MRTHFHPPSSSSVRSCVVLILFIIFVFAGSPRSTFAQTDPTCPGYAESRTLLRAVSWWSPDHDPEHSSHLHIEGCIPDFEGGISGVVPFNLKLVMFRQPDEALWTRLEAKIVQGEADTDVPLDWTPVAGECRIMPTTGGRECVSNVSVTLDTRGVPDGTYMLILRGTVERPDGRQMVATRYRVKVTNMPSDVPGREPSRWEGAGGWHVNPTRNHRYPTAGADRDTIQEAKAGVKGIWVARVNGWNNFGTLTDMRVSIDQNFHVGEPGTVLYEGAPGIVEVPVDTTMLSNGWHRFIIRVSEGDMYQAGTSFGAFSFWFLVANP